MYYLSYIIKLNNIHINVSNNSLLYAAQVFISYKKLIIFVKFERFKLSLEKSRCIKKENNTYKK